MVLLRVVYVLSTAGSAGEGSRPIYRPSSRTWLQPPGNRTRSSSTVPIDTTNVRFETFAANIDIKLSDDHLRPDALSSPLIVSALATRLTSEWKQLSATNELSSTIVATWPLVGARPHSVHLHELITGRARAERSL